VDSDLGLAPAVGHPWVDPPGASTCKAHAAFSPGCGPYLVRTVHNARARPIQNDGTLQRLLVGRLGLDQPWVTRRSTRQALPHARHMRLSHRGTVHGARARPIQNDGTLQRLLVGRLRPGTSRGSPVGRPARRFHMQGTCGFLTGLQPVPCANGPRRKGPSDTKRRDLTAPAGG
jgi:hypothetical protein